MSHALTISDAGVERLTLPVAQQPLLQEMQADGMDHEGTHGGGQCPQRDGQGFQGDAVAGKESLDQQHGAEGHEHVFTKEQADVVGCRGAGTYRIALGIAEFTVQRAFGGCLAHRRQQRTHRLWVAGNMGQAGHADQLPGGEIGDLQTCEGESTKTRNPALGALAQAVMFKHANRRQGE